MMIFRRELFSRRVIIYAIWLALALFLASVVAWGQSTTISSTGVVDTPDGSTWINGTYTITFVPNPSWPSIAQYQWTGGNLINNSVFTGSLSNTATFSVSIPSNTAITPSGSKWKVTFCPNASAGCVNTNVSVTGATLDVTAALNAVAVSPRFPADPFAFGYTTSEITPTPLPGSQFFNTTNQTCTQWSGPPGNVWGSCFNTTGFLPLTGGTITGNLTVDGTSTLCIVNGWYNPTCAAGADFGAQLNNTYAACITAGLSGCPIWIPSGTYTVTTPVQFMTKGVGAKLQCANTGTILNWTPTSGTMFQFAPAGAGSSTWPSGMDGCTVMAPSTGTVTIVTLGVSSSDVTGRTAQGVSFKDDIFRGGNIQMDLESQSWNNTFDHVKFEDAITNGFFSNVSDVNSGENISFVSSTFDVTSSTFPTSYVSLNLLSAFTTFTNSNFDNVQLNNTGGYVTCQSCYFEDPNSARGSSNFINNAGVMVAHDLKFVNHFSGDTSPDITNAGTFSMHNGSAAASASNPVMFHPTGSGHGFLSGDIFSQGPLFDDTSTTGSVINITNQFGFNSDRVAVSWSDSTGGSLSSFYTNAGVLRYHASSSTGAEVSSWGPNATTPGNITLSGIANDGTHTLSYLQCTPSGATGTCTTSGALTTSNVLTVNTPSLPAISAAYSASSSGTIESLFGSSLSTGNFLQLMLGTSNSTNNDRIALTFDNNGGSGSSSNNGGLGVGSANLVMNANGHVDINTNDACGLTFCVNGQVGGNGFVSVLTPTFTLGAGAGTGASVVCSSGVTCTPNYGAVTVTVGTGPSASADVLTISWSPAWNHKAIGIIQNYDNTSATFLNNALNDVGASTTSSCVIFQTTALTAGHSVSFNYICM